MNPVAHMTCSRPPSFHDRQKGGMAIILALILLSIMGASAFSLTGHSLREIATTGNESTGQKASESADAAIDWVIVWSNPKSIYDAAGVLRTDGTAVQNSLRASMDYLINAIDLAAAQTVGTDPKASSAAGSGYAAYGNVSDTSGTMRVFFRSLDYPGTEMYLAKQGSTGFSQTSDVVQSFDTEIRYLGRPLGNRASGYKAQTKGRLFLLSSIGRATVGNTGQSFIARREALMDYIP